MSASTKLTLIIIVLVSFGLGLIWFGAKQTPSSTTELVSITTTSEASSSGQTPIESGQMVLVSRVVDGDTIEISNGQKVRYIGIDTPETVDPRRSVACFGKEASAENKKLVEGKEVILVKDISETDKYGRLLRYVYVTQEDGSLLFVNDYLVRAGFAKAATYPPDVKFTDQFVSAEKEAREKKIGLWQKCY